MKFKIYILAMLAAVSTSCQDFWGGEPDATLIEDNFYTTEDDMNIAAQGLYSQLIANPQGSWKQGLFVVGEIGTDASQHYSATSTTYSPIGCYSIYSYNPVFQSIWSAQYKGIANVNSFLSNVNQSAMVVEMEETVKKALEEAKLEDPEIFDGELEEIEAGIRDNYPVLNYTAEARFLRAFYYTTLVRIFGGVPLYSTPVVSDDNMSVSRATLKDCYSLIIDDLKFASKYLPVAWSGRVGRATSWSAKALLAKTYLNLATYKLYSGIGSDLNPKTSSLNGVNSYEWVDEVDAYEQAKLVAEDIITVYDASNSMLAKNILDNFYPNENTSEILFDIQFSSSTSASIGGSHGNMGSLSKLGGSLIYPVHEFYESFDKRDARQRWSCDNIAYQENLPDTPWMRLETYNYTYSKVHKEPGYEDFYVASNTPINFAFIRLSEVYMIYAEALAGFAEESGEGTIPVEAFEALNKIARRSYTKGDKLAPVVFAPRYTVGLLPEWEIDYNTYGPYDTAFSPFDESSLPLYANRYATDDGTGVESDIFGQFRNLILDQRAREFCMEGLYWYDLQRMGKLENAIKRIEVDWDMSDGAEKIDKDCIDIAKLSIRPYHCLRPIPKDELSMNPNLEQNQGYSM